jgi:phage terminase large subunit GpA-like protein
MSATIPKGILYLTAGVDTQADRLVYLIVGWGKGRECWLVETGALYGDPKVSKVWEELAKVTLEAIWRFPEGGDIRIGRMLVDTGFHWEETLRFCKEHWSGGRMLPCKGLGADKRKTVGGGPIIHSENRTKRPPYATVINVDVNVAKDQISGMLAKTEPGPGFIHIPGGPGGAPVRGFDQHVIEEFTAESCTLRMVNGFKQYSWHKVAHRSNERLDCLVYALAALVHSRVELDKLPGPLVESEAKGQKSRPEPERPAWGVIARTPLPNEEGPRTRQTPNGRSITSVGTVPVNNLWYDVDGNQRHPDKMPAHLRWGAINGPLEW